MAESPAPGPPVVEVAQDTNPPHTERASLNPRVLVVDDHEPWRRQVRALLHCHGTSQVIGEAADGVDAVQRAQELAPDLILLDIELPSMNGIEAARKILTNDPRARILFVTAHRSWDIAEAAFATGAHGYLLKQDAGHELLPATQAVARDRPFISTALVGGTRSGAGRQRRVHEVTFYSDDVPQLDDLANFAATALTAGKSLIVGTRASKRDAMAERLRSRMNLDRAVDEGRYQWFDAADAMSTVIVDGWPDENRFRRNATSMIIQAAGVARCEWPRVAACGETSATLVESGLVDAAIRLERLWDDVAAAFNVDSFCAFPMPAQGRDERLLRRISAEHTAAYSR